MHAMLRRPLPLALAVVEKAILEFSNQWLAGLQPQLSLETGKDGQIWVHSRVAAGDIPSRAILSSRCQEGEAVQSPNHHRHGTSYQRAVDPVPISHK